MQGFTEPLPISSSGHLFLFKNVFNTDMLNDLNFEIFVNFGSFLAILIIFLFALSIKFLGIAFLITAISLFLVKNVNGNKDDKDLTIKDALIIGLLQMVALCPGISRSGIVLVGCLLCKLKKDTALKYTFMLYFPVSVASMGLGVLDFLENPASSSLLICYVLGMIFAGIVTYYSYKWLSNIVKKGKLWKFSIYCLCLALFVFIYFR